MRYSFLPLLVALVAVGLAPAARAQGPAPASCTLGTAQADLGINNALGRVFNNGSLFYGNGSAAFYFVPATSQRSPVYASGLWVGGLVDGQLRVAGGTYGAPALDFTFWPGPLGANGQPANPTCAGFDRIYNVSRVDIANAEAGNPTGDVLTWPFELGAPVLDGDGVVGNYNFAGGDRPDIIGDQGLWWVMNDVGNVHPAQNTPPLGIEVQTLAFSFSRSDALGSTTFYRYRIVNKSGTDITDAYVSLFSDPDLGDASDDLVGSDVEAGLGYVYNEDNEDGDGSPPSYGTPPPAVGYDFFQGPIVNGDTLGASAFSYFINGQAGLGDPTNGQEVYNLQQGLFADGSVMRAFGTGYQQTQGDITKFAFSGDAVTDGFWSEKNIDGAGTDNQGNDRRFAVHTGPFTLNNGDQQDIVFGIVFGQGGDNLDSITALRAADRLAQTAYDIGFRLAPPPPAPALCTDRTESTAPTSDDFGSGNCFEAVEQDGGATLVWGYPTTSSNYLGQFEVIDQLLGGQGATDSTYNFEGFNVYRYTSSSFETSTRTLVATYDIINGVTTVRDLQFDPTLGGPREFITARGTDSGLQYSYDIQNVTNFTDYFYGITAYAYNDESIPKVNESSATQITVRPARLTGGVETASVSGDSLIVTATTQRGEGAVRARVVDPTRLTGDVYQVRFFRPTNQADSTLAGVTTYDIVRISGTTETIVLNGQEYFNLTGLAYPQGNNVTVVDGFTFDIAGPQPGFKTFQTVANASGPLDPPIYASAQFNGSGFPALGNPALEVIASNGSPTPDQQVGPGTFLIQQGSIPASFTYDVFIERITRGGANFPIIGADNYEWRFTGPSLAARAFEDGDLFLTVPFELWNIGTTNDSAADDFRLVPFMLPVGTPEAFNLGNVDHAISGGINDPFTDLIYWREPSDRSPGQAGYNAYAGTGTPNLDAVGPEVFARTTLVGFNAGTTPNGPYNQSVPEAGTIFRFVTLKPNQPGDVFSINTAGRQASVPAAADREAALDLIAAVPNPYLGTSSYESGNLSRVVRFTNLPEETATIRIFTVSGSLVNTLRKDGPARSLDWNLETSNNLPVASGMYLVHVSIEGVGERTLKLGIVNRRTQISIF